MSFKTISITGWRPSLKLKVSNHTGKTQSIFLNLKKYEAFGSGLEIRINCGTYIVCLCNLKMLTGDTSKKDILLAIPPDCKLSFKRRLIGPMEMTMSTL